jgi:hypothetical protein
MPYAVGFVVLAAAVAAGFPLGRWLRSRRTRDYWMSNGAAVLLAIAVTAAGTSLAIPYLTAAGIGLGFGLITGMKYGLGAVTGIHAPEDRE